MTDTNWLRRCTDFRAVWRRIMTGWSPCLTGNDLLVVWCVFDRTVAVGHPVAAIPAKEFCEVCAGLSRSTIWRSVQKLVRLGMLIVSRVKSMVLYALNQEWKKEKNNMSGKPSPPSRELLLLSKKPQDRKPEESAKSIEEIRARVRETKLVSQEARAKQREKRGGFLTMSSLLAVWRIAITETFGKEAVTSLKKTEIYGLLAWQKRRGKADFAELLDWVLRNWSVAVGAQFAWMNNAPSLPVAAFMVRFSSNMEVVYAMRDTVKPVVEKKEPVRDVSKALVAHRLRSKEAADRNEEWSNTRAKRSTPSFDEWK